MSTTGDSVSEYCPSPRESLIGGKITQTTSPLIPPSFSSHAGDVPIIHRNEDVWYEDGTVVLQAHTTAFRVYRGILTSQSKIFADMFAMILPRGSFDSGAEQQQQPHYYDGCPVIQVHDSPDEMTFFLKALHDYNYAKHLPSLPIISALLRLGTKYGVEPLRERAIQALSLQYPSTRADYDNRLTKAGPYIPGRGDDLLVINLARRFDVLQVLPAAFYRAATAYTASELFEGILDDIPLEAEEEEEGSKKKRRKRLVDPRDVRIAIAAQTTVIQKAPRWVFLQDSTDIPGCKQKATCNAVRLRWASSKRVEKINFLLSTEETSGEAVDGSGGGLTWWEEWKRAMCSACVTDAEENWGGVRSMSWKNLPMLFELPPWDVILSGT